MLRVVQGFHADLIALPALPTPASKRRPERLQSAMMWDDPGSMKSIAAQQQVTSFLKG